MISMVKARKPIYDLGRGPSPKKTGVGEAAYPTLCGRCAVQDSKGVHYECEVCGHLAFQEAIFCDLNRSVQNWNRFNCYAFRPISKLRLSSVKSAEDTTGGQGSVISGGDDRLLSSDRFKYREALAIQRAREDPDGVSVDIKYHVAWNVLHRKPVFVRPADTRLVIDDAFSACGRRIGGLASVLWLAPDHIHIYIESDGEKSLEAIAKELKRASALALRGELNSQGLFSGMARRVWDGAYFTETVG